MLSDSSYMTAMYAYCGAAALFVLFLAWWLGRRWPNGWTALVVALVAALMLTPAYPREGAQTLAPALVVAGFQTATEGVEAAQHAIRPLLVTCAAAVVLALLLRLTLLRPRQRPRQEPDQGDRPDTEPAVKPAAAEQS
ncbi:hypothetical protein F0M18_06510 [Pseudohalioglobus sediminis]|uniref:Uncharacterized protein n=1 Tax=Pseudohalioglobus sediminis TaxID=2606449 RepID=A0A5B0X2I0_9GAMM|nr:hypothetical protein [Pseudohalioglobus sediminis]KAA1193483.1 hypothetical protein F0M18_06510 [Pseudohalioglobus sediminis]